MKKLITILMFLGFINFGFCGTSLENGEKDIQEMTILKQQGLKQVRNDKIEKYILGGLFAALTIYGFKEDTVCGDIMGSLCFFRVIILSREF